MPPCISIRLRRNHLVSDKLKVSLNSSNPEIDQENPFCLKNMSLLMSSVGI